MFGGCWRRCSTSRTSASGTTFAPDLGVYGGWVAHAGSYAARQSSAALGPSSTLLLAGECFGQDTARHAPHWPAATRHMATTSSPALNGLFAGLLIDRARQQALLFNDRYGSERLYTFEKDGAIYFASEAKALLAVLPELRAFDDTGVAQFLAFGSTMDGHTLFRGFEARARRVALALRGRGTAAPHALLHAGRLGSAADAHGRRVRVNASAETFEHLLPAYLRADQTGGPVADRRAGHADDRRLHASRPAARGGLHLRRRGR